MVRAQRTGATELETLHTLLEQAEQQRNIALAAFNHSRARRDEARTQARDLALYRDDYSARWSGQFQRGAALEVLRSYQQFAARLELAISQQAHALTVCEQALTRANDVLTAHELRVASVRKLIERRQHELRQGIERREQGAEDEQAARRRTQQRNPFAQTFAGTQP
jgi:flagellar FliJ protein